MSRASRGSKRSAAGSVKTEIVLPSFKVQGGNRIDQETADDEHEALSEMVNLLYSNRKHCHHMLSRLRKRLKAEEEEKEKEEGCDLLGATSWGAVVNSEQAALKFLPKHTDLSVQDLSKMKKADTDSWRHLLSMAGQMPRTAQIAEGCQDELVREKSLLKRMEESGSAETLNNLKASGGLCEDGSLNLVKVSRYGFEVDDTHIQTLTHRHTSITVDVSSYKLDLDWKQACTWSDWEGQLERPPLKPQKLSTFFKAGQGPHSLPKITTKAGWLDHAMQVAAFVAEVQTARQLIRPKQAEEAATLAKELQTQKAEKKAAITQKAQSAALKALAEKKASRRKALTSS